MGKLCFRLKLEKYPIRRGSASRRVEAPNHPTNPPNLPKPPNQSPRGRVYPLPTPSQTVRLAQSFVLLVSSGPSGTSKKRQQNVYLLLMSPIGADNGTIKLATTPIIPAIRRPYAQSGSKVTPKWSQSVPKVALRCQKLPHGDPRATPT